MGNLNTNMEPNRPVVFINEPSGIRHFFGTFKSLVHWWRGSLLWVRIASIFVLAVLVGGIIWGGIRLARPETKPVTTPVQTPHKKESKPTPPAGTTTPKAPTEQPPAPNKNTAPTPKQSTPSTTPATGGGTGNTGSGGGGSSGGGGGGSSFPSASNTGPSGCGSYTQYSGTLDVTVDGTTLNCIQLSGTLTINASNVTVQNSILTGNSWWGIRVGNTTSSVTNFKLSHSKLQTVPGLGPDAGGYDYGISQEAAGYMEIAYNDISGYKDGVTTSKAWIHDNYIHDLSQFIGAHTQDVYVYTGPGQVKIEHNTLINDSPQSQATAAIYIAPDDGHQNDRIVTNNLLAGGAYTLYGGDATATNIVVTNNQFSTQRYPNSGYYGPVAYWQAGNSGNTWSGNTWADGASAGQAIDP